MVKEIISKKGKFYQCEECNFIYKTVKWAEKCEQWCRKNKSCNVMITKHAVDMSEFSSSL